MKRRRYSQLSFKASALLFVPRDFLDGPAPACKLITTTTITHPIKTLTEKKPPLNQKCTQSAHPCILTSTLLNHINQKPRRGYFLPQLLLLPFPPWTALHHNPIFSFNNTQSSSKQRTT
ncbi:hypothetical protein KC19_7G085500 [Ceratodon purpureus]|uniref:Uncharacterized protein n=1 Tax=Ceratodon purpureus TaxID=3225 RepID=A0A8T0H8S9_CERPU|nr:hypothetical protein KC19_7G085500 [Ceratodon purpureus]